MSDTYRVYNKILRDYQHKIQTNKFARQLESRYHKSNHKPIRIKTSKPLQPFYHQWPVESPIFTNILHSKLEKCFPALKNYKIPNSKFTQNKKRRFLTPNERLEKLPLKFDLTRFSDTSQEISPR